MQFHFRISHNAYSLFPEVCLHQHLLFLNLLSDNDAFANNYPLGDHQFLFQNGNGEGTIWEGLYILKYWLLHLRDPLVGAMFSSERPPSLVNSLAERSSPLRKTFVKVVSFKTLRGSFIYCKDSSRLKKER
jgi:hypothetical protein